MAALSNLSVGSNGILVALGGERSFRRRLMEMGLLPGTRVQMVRRNDLGGVLEVEARHCRMTLRQAEAAQLLVTVE